MREILAHASDEAVVLALDVHRHRVALLSRLVPEHAARETVRTDPGPGSRVILTSVSTFTATEWAVNTGTRTVVGDDRQIRRLQDLAHLVDQLQLLAGVPVVAELSMCGITLNAI